MKKLILASTAALIAISVFTGCSDDDAEAVQKKAAGAVTTVSNKTDALNPGDSVKIEFNCTAGEQYDVDVDYTGDSYGSLDFYLYSPSGEEIYSSFQAGETGTYYVVIKAPEGNSGALSYSFTVDKIQLSNEIYGKWYTSYVMEAETWINDNGGTESDTYEESYANVDESNDVYEITKDSIFNYYRYREGLEITLEREAAPLAEFSELAQAQIVNGTIVVEESGSEEGESWNYKEVFSRYNGDVPPANWKEETTVKPSTTESISLDETKDGSISSFSDTKWYKVSLKDGDKVHFEITKASYDTYMILTDSEGVEISNNDDYTELLSGIDYTCTADGDYYVVVAAYSHFGTFSLVMNSDYVENSNSEYGEVIYNSVDITRSADKKKAKKRK